ncbi:hypothetical protein CesoFtcFv8_020254 [Champsocephalus esox]|uniref:Uncharacterized protein n=1 Tax=Champsocephalus esox TaxID=159716 RepID=A0AAN8GMY9_9TELE|nr:hypothetical protein CesoFtcFv8_020254 [Champsocephalus esox]
MLGPCDLHDQSASCCSGSSLYKRTGPSLHSLSASSLPNRRKKFNSLLQSSIFPYGACRLSVSCRKQVCETLRSEMQILSELYEYQLLRCKGAPAYSEKWLELV